MTEQRPLIVGGGFAGDPRARDEIGLPSSACPGSLEPMSLLARRRRTPRSGSATMPQLVAQGVDQGGAAPDVQAGPGGMAHRLCHALSPDART